MHAIVSVCEGNSRANKWYRTHMMIFFLPLFQTRSDNSFFGSQFIRTMYTQNENGLYPGGSSIIPPSMRIATTGIYSATTYGFSQSKGAVIGQTHRTDRHIVGLHYTRHLCICDEEPRRTGRQSILWSWQRFAFDFCSLCGRDANDDFPAVWWTQGGFI